MASYIPYISRLQYILTEEGHCSKRFVSKIPGIKCLQIGVVCSVFKGTQLDLLQSI